MEFRELTERYDLAKILHSGRSATVLRATDKRSGQAVVVKMIQAAPTGFEEAAARFEAFAAALSVIRYSGLPAVLDSGITRDGGAFLVMEVLEGRRLDTLAGKLQPDAAMALVSQTLDALEALAACGLAHGNLSPDNLFAVANPDGSLRLKLLGLGSAVFRSPGSAAPESARFLAPELAHGGVPTVRSDLYSFALSACHLLGAAVTPGESPGVQLPFSIALEVENDAALREILERMLRRDPAVRPSFREVRAAFRQALGDRAATPAPLPAVSAVQASPPPASSPSPFPPVAVPATVAEPEHQGEVLRSISDEVLAALTAPPPPPPMPAKAEPATPALAPSRRNGFLLSLVAATVVAVLAVGFWLLRSDREPPPAPVAAPAVPIPPPPSAEAALAKLDAARLFVAQGEDLRAQEVVQAFSYQEQSVLPAEACARLADLEATLALLAAERLPGDLARGLEGGDLGVLRSVVATGSSLGEALPVELREDFARASHLVELHRLIEADAAQGRNAAVLERFGELKAASPRIEDPLDLRGKAALAIEGEAEALAVQARYDDALAKLEPLQKTWPDREGLDARLTAYRTAAEAEPKQQALLASLPAWERRKRPDEALELLRDVTPTPHLRAQIEEARKRLESQLAQLDQAPPQIVLRDGYLLEYSRGTVVDLSFRVTDDYGIRSVKVMARPPGGRMRELPLEISRAGYYTVTMQPSFHQNGTVELYVVATDLSGHEGRYGTPDKPLQLTRIGSNRI